MMKRDKQMYCSTRIIGKLFRQCKSLIKMHSQSKLKTVVHVDNDFILPSIETRIIEGATRDRDQYVRKVVELLDLYGIRNESEAITGLVQSFKSVSGRLKDEKFQVGQIIKEKMLLIQKRARQSFFEEFGGETNVLKEDQQVIHKASAWYKVTYKCKNEASRQILSFPWIVADVLSSLKKIPSREPYLSRITDFLNQFYDISKEEKRNIAPSLRLMHVNVKTLLGKKLCKYAEKPVGLGFCGILKRQAILHIATTEMQLESIAKTIKEHGIVVIDKSLHCPILRYRVTNDENAYVDFVTDSRIINLSETMEKHLSKRFKFLKPVVQFLLDILQDTFPKDTYSYVFSDLVVAVIVYHGQSFCKKSENPLLGVLRHFINCFRSWNLSQYPTLNDGWDALRISPETMSKISDKMIFVYQKIAVEQYERIFTLTQAAQRVYSSHVLQNFVQDEEKDYVYHEVFTQDPSMLGSIRLAQIYVEHQLKIRTDADVFFTRLNPIQLEAIGTSTALHKVEDIIDDFLETSSAVLPDAEKGHVIVENAYSVIFQGGDRDTQITFEEYTGICHERHHKHDRYWPKLKQIYLDENYSSDFEIKFIQQWNVLKNEYNLIFHGEICMSITLGTFYVMNIQQGESMDVTKFNKLLNTIEDRKSPAKNAKQIDVPYIFSFHPFVSNANGSIGGILERLGFCRNDEGRKTVTVKFKEANPVICKFMGNGEFTCMDLPDIKWFMANVIPKACHGSTQIKHIRYKLQTLRKIDEKCASRLEGYKTLIKKRKFLTLTTTGDGYIVDEFFNSKTVSFAQEKEIDTYCSRDNSNCKIEVVTVRELKPHVLSQTSELALLPCTDLRTEVTILPRTPTFKASESELKLYARYIWEMALNLATELENSIKSAETL